MMEFAAGFVVAAVWSLPVLFWDRAILRAKLDYERGQVDTWRYADRCADLDNGLTVAPCPVCEARKVKAEDIPPFVDGPAPLLAEDLRRQLQRKPPTPVRDWPLDDEEPVQ